MIPAKDEIEGLLDRGSYVVVQKKDIPKGAVIPKSRIYNEIKQDEYRKNLSLDWSYKGIGIWTKNAPLLRYHQYSVHPSD